ncbi:hypothetical protein BASA60_010835, partial [Batrachochytrium salamandrivorans]
GEVNYSLPIKAIFDIPGSSCAVASTASSHSPFVVLAASASASAAIASTSHQVSSNNRVAVHISIAIIVLSSSSRLIHGNVLMLKARELA